MRTTLITRALLAAVVLVAASALPTTVYGHGQVVTATPDTVEAGGKTAISGEEFGPNIEVNISVHGQTGNIATVQSDSKGEFTAEVSIPRNVFPGIHNITATDARGERGEVEITIIGANRSSSTSSEGDAGSEEDVSMALGESTDAAERVAIAVLIGLAAAAGVILLAVGRKPAAR